MNNARVSRAIRRPTPSNVVQSDDDEPDFHYPASHKLPSERDEEETEEEDVFTYQPSSSQVTPHDDAEIPLTSRVEFEKIYAAATSGDFDYLQRLFKAALADGFDSFTIANEANPRTGLTLLHSAASKGHLDVVQWLATDCGAMVNVEDKEGETAIHKASLNGHLSIVNFLLTMPYGSADVNSQDADGWTPLHNACSKGYLDIVKYLCEQAGGSEVIPGSNPPIRGVDQKSKGGWTPLMNAASKGHMPTVMYLLQKARADPLIRNKWGETAYDIASSVFEIYIAALLSKAELNRWREPVVYNELAVHTTVGVMLYENQRLVNKSPSRRVGAIVLGTSAATTLQASGSSETPRGVKWTTSGLGRRGIGAFELKMPSGSGGQTDQRILAWRSEIELPTRRAPFVLPYPKPSATRISQTETTTSSMQGEERSHFWLSDWTLDLSDPKVDAEEGWQYSESFDASEGVWTPSPIPPTQTSSGSRVQGSRVRRRKWVRLLRRRLDIPPLPFMEPNGLFYALSPSTGDLVPYTDKSLRDEQGDEAEDELQDAAELTFMPLSSGSQIGTRVEDYVSRAKYVAGESADANVGDSGANLRRSITKLERAVSELRIGLLGDDNMDRKTQAEVLLNVYSRELEKQRLSAGARGMYITNDEDLSNDEDDDSEFHYPSPSPGVERRLSYSSASDYFSRSRRQSTSIDLTPQLAQAPDFRVPTHDAPKKASTPRWRASLPNENHPRWERDEEVQECRSCRRRFTFLFRKHHCRRCGRIYCDKCTSRRAVLEPSVVVLDPATNIHSEHNPSTAPLRVCEPCFQQVNGRDPALDPRLTASTRGTLERLFLRGDQLSVPASRSADNLSQISDLAECPVCCTTLAEVGSAVEQEAHVRSCLEGGSGGSDAHMGRYLTYNLPAESTLIGTECVICLEEFAKGALIARLSCWCSFHSACLSAWLQRGRSCPVHAR